MPTPVLQLRVGLDDQGGWRLLLGEPGRAPVEGRVGPERVRQLQARCAAAAVAEEVLVLQHDLKLTRAESEAGRALAGALGADPAIARAWQRALGSAEGRLVLALSTEDADVAGLPWELLATSETEDLLELGGGLVVRLEPGPGEPAPRPAPTRLRVWVWCPNPEDPVCAARLASLHSELRALGLPAPTGLNPLQSPLPPPEPGEAELLHLVAHGWSEEDLSAVCLRAEGAVGPGAAAGLLGADWARFGGVVLDVCSAGDPRAGSRGSLAGTCLRRGARAVIAPARPALLEASQAFSPAFYRALARGEPLERAVRDGRAQVRALGLAHPAGRATNLLLAVCSAAVPTEPLLVPPGPRPEGWPPVDAQLGALLERAGRIARREQQGHLGLEHLVRAWEPGEGGRVAALLGRKVRAQVSERQWAALSSLPWATAALTPTPRVRALLADAPAPADVDALWRAIALDPHHGLHRLAGAPLGPLLELAQLGPETPGLPAPALTTPVPARGLQVLWGPWDGRELRPAPGQSLGRGDQEGGPELPLSDPQAAWGDRRTSRSHLRWLGPGQVDACVLVRHFATGGPEGGVEHKGPLALRVGDLLLLGDHTWLRAIA